MGVLAVLGGEQVSSGAQSLLVRLREQDEELPGQLVQEQAAEEGLVLLAPGQRRSISARSSDGFWLARGGRLKKCSTR